MTISEVFSEHPGAVCALDVFVFVRKPLADCRILTPAPPACPALVLASPPCCSVASKGCGGSASAVSPDEWCFGTECYSTMCSQKPFSPVWAAHSSFPVVCCATSLACSETLICVTSPLFEQCSVEPSCPGLLRALSQKPQGVPGTPRRPRNPKESLCLRRAGTAPPARPSGLRSILRAAPSASPGRAEQPRGEAGSAGGVPCPAGSVLAKPTPGISARFIKSPAAAPCPGASGNA